MYMNNYCPHCDPRCPCCGRSYYNPFYYQDNYGSNWLRYQYTDTQHNTSDNFEKLQEQITNMMSYNDNKNENK